MVVLRESGAEGPVEICDDEVTFKVYHGGELVELDGNSSYVGGSIRYFDHCSVDFMSLLELDEMAKLLGYENVSFWFRGTEGMVMLTTDKMVCDLVEGIPLERRRELSIYLKHQPGFIKSTTLDDFINEAIQKIGDNVEDADAEDNENQDDQYEGIEENVGQDEDTESDEDFEDPGYEQSDEDLKLLKEDDDLFDSYVDHTAPDKLDLDENDQISDSTHSEGLHTPEDSSENDDDVYKKPSFDLSKCPVFRPEVDMKNVQFCLKLRFASATIFRDAVRQFSIQSERELKFVKNDPTAIRARCVHKKCPFVIFVSAINGSQDLIVKTYKGVHWCSKSITNKAVNANYIARRYAYQLSCNPNWNCQAFKEQVSIECKVKISTAKVYRAREKAAKIMEGTYTEQFEALWDYADELMRTNVGSTVVIKSELEGDRPRFQRIYICLAALKEGFIEGCRPFIGLDGCHIKGPYPGQILAAVGVDANNGMFPIAYAVVEVENYSSWRWFLELLEKDLKIENSHGYVFMTDKQKGLVDAIGDLFPNSEHRHCLKHLYANFSGVHKGLALKHQMENIARVTCIQWFDTEMKKMLDMDEAAFKWLHERPAKHWALSHFKTDVKCDKLLNNFCEAFNKAILGARDKPILTMLERIRLYLMLLTASRRTGVERWHHDIGPRVFKIVEKLKEESLWCIPRFAGENKFQVATHEFTTHVVDLTAHTCSCRAWNVSGIPCVHACSAISHYHGDPIDFVSNYYKKEAYQKTYKPMIQPMTSRDIWPKGDKTPLMPPVYHKQPGRPKKARVRATNEFRRPPSQQHKLRRFNLKIKCSRCGQEGHNVRSCPKAKQGGSNQASTSQSTSVAGQDKVHKTRVKKGGGQQRPTRQRSNASQAAQGEQSQPLTHFAHRDVQHAQTVPSQPLPTQPNAMIAEASPSQVTGHKRKMNPQAKKMDA